MPWFGPRVGFNGPALPAFVGFCLGWYTFVNQGCPCTWPLLCRFFLKFHTLSCISVWDEVWGISCVNRAELRRTYVPVFMSIMETECFFNRWLRWVQPRGPLGLGLRGQAQTCSLTFHSQACTDPDTLQHNITFCWVKYRWEKPQNYKIQLWWLNKVESFWCWSHWSLHN